LDLRKELQEKYNFHITSPAKKDSNYSVQIGDNLITLKVQNESSAKILSANEKLEFANKEFFENLNTVDLIEFR
jgi:hypothetical protein